jgi:hypothetical protein
MLNYLLVMRAPINEIARMLEIISFEGVGRDEIEFAGGIRLVKNVNRSMVGNGSYLNDQDSYDIIDGGGKNIGFVHVIDNRDHFQIGNVMIKNERMGLGYEMYKKLISILDKPLISDEVLSDKARGLWEKLVGDGLAERFEDSFKYGTKDYVQTRYRSLK